MASSIVRLQPPEPFNFKAPDEWPRWKRRFLQFRDASGFGEEDDRKQVSTLLYCMGESAEDVLASTDISADERKSFDSVIAKFDSFFKVRKNVIFERARFNCRSQEEGESTEAFITCLYQLVENCEYGDMKDQMLRDRIVVGIRDKALSQRMQLDAELTLEKAKTLSRQREAIREQQVILGSTTKATQSVDHIHKSHQKGSKRNQFQWSKPSTGRTQPSKTCTRCGRGPHPRHQCPARDAQCHKCKNKGHFAAHCRSKSVAEVSNTPLLEQEYDDIAYLNTLDSQGGNCLTCDIQVNGHNVNFKVDTGAEVTVISEDISKTLGLELSQTAKSLHGPDRSPLKVSGQATVRLAYKEKQCTQPIYVLHNVKHNLLGLPAIRELQVLSQIHTVSQPVHEPTHIPDQFPLLFKGLGTFKGGSYTIQLKPDAKPFALYTPRNVPIPLRDKVREELSRMQALGVISPVEEPTEWCAGMVVVPKSSGAVRICVDFRSLNESVLREVHPLPKVDTTLAQLGKATRFSKVDANCGFWQIPLSEESRRFTTFITPFGRYSFNKLPFGISSAPEHFQRRMSQILAGQDGVLCHMDDALIFGSTQQEHDERLHAALSKIQDAGLTLNANKCEFNKEEIHFLGHVINRQGISPDPQKTEAVRSMEKPRSPTELRRFMGMVNQLGKFSSKIAELSQPLRELLSIKRTWQWGTAQDKAFEAVKAELTRPTTLALYDQDAPTKITADASAYGIGAVLLQQQNKVWKPVAYASKSMTETERRYSQIEKEALALVWACEKFEDYVLGKEIQLETDHKPLVPLLGKMHLDSLPPRILRFKLRLMRFSYSIVHVPGKELYTADTLSRAPLLSSGEPEHDYIEQFVATIVSTLPANADRLQEYRTAQLNDVDCAQLIHLCRNGWPQRKQQVPVHVQPCWSIRGELTLNEDLLLRGRRIVVPQNLQKETLQKIHQGHQGITKCSLRATSSVWWLGLKQQLDNLIHNCPECSKAMQPPRQPLICTPLPSYPWERIASDLFELDSKTYLLVVDYFSRYVEVQTLSSTTSASVIKALKAIFSRHGIPATMVSDNGPQYSSQEFQRFSQEYNFTHTTSSPHYPQSNGLAERMVRTVKSILSKSSDPYSALLAYRSTPLPWCGYSPAELIMGRKLRSEIPQHPCTFIPEWSYLPEFQKKDRELKERQKKDYDHRHRVRPQETLLPDESVWVHTQNRKDPGCTIGPADTPRSYLVQTPSGVVRRNQSHLTPRPSIINTDETPQPTPEPSQDRVSTRSQTGVQIGPPSRLTYWRKGDVVSD
jgi:transposase InsO family protein